MTGNTDAQPHEGATQNKVELAPLEGEQNSSTTVMVATSVGTLPNYKILMVFILVFHKNC